MDSRLILVAVLIKFGIINKDTGEIREANCASLALDMWQNRTGKWRLVIDGRTAKED
jgi:hypothetical protein